MSNPFRTNYILNIELTHRNTSLAERQATALPSKLAHAKLPMMVPHKATHLVSIESLKEAVVEYPTSSRHGALFLGWLVFLAVLADGKRFIPTQLHIRNIRKPTAALKLSTVCS